MRRKELESQMLLCTGSQEKGAGRLVGPGGGSATPGAGEGVLGGVAHPEAAAGRGVGVPALQWDLSAPVQWGGADRREMG